MASAEKEQTIESVRDGHRDRRHGATEPTLESPKFIVAYQAERHAASLLDRVPPSSETRSLSTS
jgi:hypothetical protein